MHIFGFQKRQTQTCAYIYAFMDFFNGELHIFGTSLDFSNGEIQTGPNILIYLSEKSIYACIYAYIWVIQICAYMHAYMDFPDGEIHIIGTSSYFPLGGIQIFVNKI